MHSILQDLVAFCQHSIRFYDFYKKAKIALDGLARSTIERDVSIPIELDIETFLDNNNDPLYIRNQIRQLMSIARQNGFAIGIGHYRRNTLQTIREMIPEIEKHGITLVKMRNLVRNVQ